MQLPCTLSDSHAASRVPVQIAGDAGLALYPQNVNLAHGLKHEPHKGLQNGFAVVSRHNSCVLAFLGHHAEFRTAMATYMITVSVNAGAFVP